MRAYRPERKTADLSTTGRDDRALGAAFYARFWRRVGYHASRPPLSSRPEWSWPSGPPKVMKNAFRSATIFHGSVTLPFVISTEAKRSGEISVLTPLPGNVFRLEESWACGRPKVMKSASSSNHSLSNRCPFLCHPERSRGICGSTDLSWKCFSTERSHCLRFPSIRTYDKKAGRTYGP